MMHFGELVISRRWMLASVLLVSCHGGQEQLAFEVEQPDQGPYSRDEEAPPDASSEVPPDAESTEVLCGQPQFSDADNLDRRFWGPCFATRRQGEESLSVTRFEYEDGRRSRQITTTADRRTRVDDFVYDSEGYLIRSTSTLRGDPLPPLLYVNYLDEDQRLWFRTIDVWADGDPEWREEFTYDDLGRLFSKVRRVEGSSVVEFASTYMYTYVAGKLRTVTSSSTHQTTVECFSRSGNLIGRIVHVEGVPDQSLTYDYECWL